jgi:hypothetical protein
MSNNPEKLNRDMPLRVQLMRICAMGYRIATILNDKESMRIIEDILINIDSIPLPDRIPHKLINTLN